MTSPNETMQRVMIIGGPGAGKSTLAHSFGERTALPVYHVGHIGFRPKIVCCIHIQLKYINPSVIVKVCSIYTHSKEGGLL